jgi:hypothetical protein
MIPIDEIASVVSAAIAGASLMLDEAARETDRERRANDAHAALLTLHDPLHEWLGAAMTTNSLAREWRTQLPDSAGQAAELLRRATAPQTRWGRDVARALRTQMDIQSRRRWDWLRVRAISREPRLTLRTLLRAHAHGLAIDPDALLTQRGEILRTLPDELERRYSEGGVRSVDAFLVEMDQTITTLTEACDQLARFIRERFPIGAS